MLTVDEELGYVYLPFGTPTNDYYGGHRLSGLRAAPLVTSTLLFIGSTPAPPQSAPPMCPGI